MTLFKGSGVAIVTPFHEDRSINFEEFGKLLDWHVEQGTDAIIVCGTTGEAATLTKEEQQETIQFAVDRINKRIPVIAGTGSNHTAHAIEMSQYAESVGVDGLLVINPYYNKTTQKGIIAHFYAIADSVSIPIIVYNVPGRTGMNISPATLKELSKHKNIIGVKEASGNISQIADIAMLCGSDFSIYSGNDDHIVPILSLGGVGVISVSANIIPKDMHDLVINYLERNVEKSLELQLKTNPLNHALFIETNPIPIKTAMNLLGFKVGPLRLPLVDMEEKNLEKLKQALLNYGFVIS
ncbi:4-hydroxy-tetrahydrodipicolinate synthase [Garciella nitratireducens]|uniref:4-hydroxy-tetrahydrodipicolinate synthase n=1 Tax=Garciella nitratireducens DSM 15102 TaxID=1121911 RepID=A0A1T4LJ83_9FIRM|nr:4-hydroxy-tetrahydrodipicolinate synthase [Garciella nitratireducens]SJZ54790.1 dihydrodipicolinate synthase [Garciella nitratireducens DSM 15102]